MTSRFGLDAALFALKSYAGAILALYVAFSIGLERPYWAFMTAYIVAQPLAGAVISKALFRLVGTFVGAVAAVLMVPTLVNSPELLTLALGLWLGLCVFVSLLDRTPRSYMFVLAGYSAIIIALPSVEAPGEIFTVAILRVQEIAIGILCGSLVHAVVLPGSVAEALLGRVGAIVADAERWSADSLLAEPPAALDDERRRLALDITELHQLSIHLPFETKRLTPRVRVVRALQDQLSLLMPLGAAISDRIAILRDDGGLPADVAEVLERTRAWLAMPAGPERVTESEALLARCAELEPAVGEGSAWRDLVLLSLMVRLGGLIAAHRDCRDLAAQLATQDRRPVTPRVGELIEGRRNRELHRDYAGALRGAAGATLTIVVGTALWIASGWQDGSVAIMLAGVFLALFAASADPLVPLKGFFWGTLAATGLGALYGFAILPRLDGFVELAAALAPPLLLLGALMHSPRYMGIALPSLLGLGSPELIADHYVGDFAIFANGAVAQMVGIVFAIVMARLLQSAGVEGAIRRTVRAGWRDIAERSNAPDAPDFSAWTARMLDRIALLALRLAMSGREPGAPLFDALRDMRTGLAVGELRQLRRDMAGQDTHLVTSVLRDVGEHYRTLDPRAPQAAAQGLLTDIDAALRRFAGAADASARRAGTIALVSLRRNLFPLAPAPVESRA